MKKKKCQIRKSGLKIIDKLLTDVEELRRNIIIVQHRVEVLNNLIAEMQGGKQNGIRKETKD